MPLIFSLYVNAAEPNSNEKLIIPLDKTTGSIGFTAIGKPSALKIKGFGEKAVGIIEIKDSKLQGFATFKLDTLDTGIKLRNNHMKNKYLETNKYPEAKFIFTNADMPDDVYADNANIENLPFEGKLFLHGIENKIFGTANIEKEGDKISFIADFDLKISDFGIKEPKFAGITMAENINVRVQFKGPYSKTK